MRARSRDGCRCGLCGIDVRKSKYSSDHVGDSKVAVRAFDCGTEMTLGCANLLHGSGLLSSKFLRFYPGCQHHLLFFSLLDLGYKVSGSHRMD